MDLLGIPVVVLVVGLLGLVAPPAGRPGDALICLLVPPPRGRGRTSPEGSPLSDTKLERTFSVPAIHCAGCASTISEALEPVEGVESATVDLDSKTVRVRGTADDRVVRKVLAAAGYPPV